MNLFRNLRARNIASGFGYLSHPAGFEISDTWLTFSPGMTFGRALLVGLVDTVAAGGAIAALISLIGLSAGLVLSFAGPTGRKVLDRYVSLTRNVPVLLHVVVWYALFSQTLPPPRGAYRLGDLVLSNRGLILPFPRSFGGLTELAVGAGAAVALAGVLYIWKGRLSGRLGCAVAVAGCLAWICTLPMDKPVFRGFNYAGGWVLSVEFCALVIAIAVYTGGYVTEIVRGAVDSFPGGNVESAFALGLSRSQFFMLVMTPQVVRTIAPSMVNQYINVVKLTSLGIVVGYPDLVSVSNASLNQTGQAVEAIALILVIYLAISLVLSYTSHILFGRTAEIDSR